jgi:transposase
VFGGLSRGGLSTKIHMVVRGLGCLVRFALTAGQKSDAPKADALMESLPAQVIMADAAYESDRLRNAVAVIPNNPSRARKYPFDKRPHAMSGNGERGRRLT